MKLKENPFFLPEAPGRGTFNSQLGEQNSICLPGVVVVSLGSGGAGLLPKKCILCTVTSKNVPRLSLGSSGRCTALKKPVTRTLEFSFGLGFPCFS